MPTDADATLEPVRRREVPASVRRQLEPMVSDLRSWAVAVVVVAIAAVLRFVNLGFPPQLIFDETYYAPEGQQMLDHGVEWSYQYDLNGNVTEAPGLGGAFVVHPPLGKWLIGLGIWIGRAWFNDAPVDSYISSGAFGWRLMPAIFGVLSVLILTRTARRMFRSTLLGTVAGLLMALDGMHFVLSRTAMLDIFMMFFVLAAFACLVIDRDHRRARWLQAMENGLDPTAPGAAGRPRSGWKAVPWWRLAAAVMLGLGCGVKWSAVFYVLVFAILVFRWEVALRKTVGAERPWRGALRDEFGWIVAMVVMVIPTYLSTWTGWFVSDDGYKRHFLRDQGHAEWPILGPLYNLWSYHLDMRRFHTGLTTPHPYQSEPWQWLLLGRPVPFYFSNAPSCGAARCAAEILLLGTPMLWWAFIPALIAMAWFGFKRRDWRTGAIFAGVLGGIRPWFDFWILDNRTMYLFYALPAEPFLVLALAYVFGRLITGPGDDLYTSERINRPFTLRPEKRRLYGTIALGAFVVLVAICFWYYYPLYVGDSIPWDDWSRRLLIGLLGDRWV